MKDGNFLHLEGVTRWNSQFYLNIHERLSPSFELLHNCSFVSFRYTYGSRIGVYNTLASKNLCKIAQATKNSDSNAQHFLSDLLTHSWFHSMLFALPGYQFPYTVINRCVYLREWLTLQELILRSLECIFFWLFKYCTWGAVSYSQQADLAPVNAVYCQGEEELTAAYSPCPASNFPRQPAVVSGWWACQAFTAACFSSCLLLLLHLVALIPSQWG
jgi:hypothetical protein